MASELNFKKIHAHRQLEQLFLKYYPNFHKYLTVDDKYMRSHECVYKLGIGFLEDNYNEKRGFPGEIHHLEKVEESVSNVKTPFDTALIIPFLMDEDIEPSTITSLAKAVSKYSLPSGFYNYFQPVDDNLTFMFPCDIEDSSISMLALFLTGNKTKAECLKNAKKMLRLGTRNANGALGIWLPNIDVTSSGEPHMILYEKLLTEVKMDLAGLVNALCYMSIIGIEGEESDLTNIRPSIEFVSDLVNQLVENQGSASGLNGMIYYPNHFPVYLFLCRYTHFSPTAKKSFGEKLKVLIRGEIFKLKVPWEKAMNIACCILAALYLELHLEEESDPEDMKGNVAKNESEITIKLQAMYEKLLTMQQKDGSFAKEMVFKMTHFGHYGGSKYLSTAFVISAIGRYRRQVLEKMQKKSNSQEN